MPITFLSFIMACKGELLKRLRKNNNKITDELINSFYQYIMGGCFFQPTERQRHMIRKYAEQLLKEEFIVGHNHLGLPAQKS